MKELDYNKDYEWKSSDGKVAITYTNSSGLQFEWLDSNEKLRLIRYIHSRNKYRFYHSTPVWSTGRYVSKKEALLMLSYLTEWDSPPGEEAYFHTKGVDFLEDLEKQ